MSLLQAFKGATLYFAESKHISVEAAEKDQTKEEESLLNSFDVDDSSSLQAASEGVVIGTTLSNYQRYWNQFKEFCVTIDKAQVASEIDELFPDLPAKFLMWIAL
ncbi:hypothetical protein BD769DRAFT_1675368 [Suillus cothurnatus]|nr:hypothetical protein BD769DRAFT_1675368 [Suillus cothurnatus]